MASTQGDDETALKLRRHLQDYTNAHSDKQQPSLPPPSQAVQHSQQSQQAHPLPQIQRTHAGFQHTLGPGEPSGHLAPPPPPPSSHGSGPPPPHHPNQLPPMVDPQLGGGGQHLAPIQSPPGSQAPISSMLHSPESAMHDSERKGRQLSTTKRAAQNRAAQRKEVHIKNLEAKVQEIEPLKSQIADLQRDNYTLRGYLITMLEMIAKKGLEPPPGVPKMHMDPNSYSTAAMPAETHGDEQSANGTTDHDMSRAPDFPSQLNNPGAPTAPMQDIAQQAAQAVDRVDGPRETVAA